MHVVWTRALSAMVLLLVAAGLLNAQQPIQRTPPNTENKEQQKPELGPSTGKTKEESENSAKTPIGIAPLPTAAPVDPKTYTIGPEDILAIRVWREPELSSGVQVRPDGKITLPLIGELDAAGQTPEGLKNKIVEALNEFIVKPDVMVSVQAVQSRKYYITGEVGRSGAFPLVVPTTVLEGLTNAGGFKEFANTKKITILRKGKVLKFNYNDVVRGKNMDQNVLLENGDYIVVR